MKFYNKKFLATIIIFSLFALSLFAKESTVTPINENWEFYLNQFVTSNPQEEPNLLLNIPERWNEREEIKSANISEVGYFSYRKVISGLDPKKEYAILLAESPVSASRLLINGEVKKQIGTPATSAENEKPFFSPIYTYFSPDEKGNVEIIFHISSFYQQKNGIYNSVFFGEKNDIFFYYILQNGVAWLVIGTLAILFSLTVLLYCLSPIRRENLYFSFLTLVLAFRVGISGFSVFSIAFPNLSYKLLLLMESASIWVTPMLLCFIILVSADTKIKNHILIKIVLFSATFIGLISLFLPESATGVLDPFIDAISVSIPLFIFVFLITQIKVDNIITVLNLSTIVVLTMALAFEMFFKSRTFSNPFQVYPLFFFAYAIFQFATLAVQQSIMHNKQKRLVRHLKQLNDVCLSFVPKEFLKQIDKNSINKVELGNYSEKQMTITYTNLDFISKWESDLSSEQEYVLFSECVAIILPIIQKHNGYISKILSENIISLFPNHPSDAVNCYLEITEKLTEYANREENNYFALKKATGLHYGNILLGTIGEENRLDDTVISETVNVVSRLSKVAKTYNVDFVFSDEVFNIIRENKFDFAQLGITTIKGKSQPLSIYTCTSRQNDVWGGESINE